MFEGCRSATGMEGEQKLLKCTKICKFNLRGECTRGSSCNFAHSPHQLKQQPDFTKTRFCIEYLRYGECADGAECKFAHSDGELRPGTSATKVLQEQMHQGHTEQLKQRLDGLQEFVKSQYQHNHVAMRLLLENLHQQPASTASRRQSQQLEQATKQLQLVDDGLSYAFQGQCFSRQTTQDPSSIAVGFGLQGQCFSRQTTPGSFGLEVTESSSECWSVDGCLSQTPSRTAGLSDFDSASDFGTPAFPFARTATCPPMMATCGTRSSQEPGDNRLSVKNTFLEVTCSDEEKEAWAGSSRARARSAPPRT